MSPLDYDALTAVAEGAAKGSWETTDAELDAFIATFNPETALRLLSAAREAEGLREAAERLVTFSEALCMAADHYGVKHLDSDDMDDEAVQLQAATLAMRHVLDDANDALARTAPPADGGK